MAKRPQPACKYPAFAALVKHELANSPYTGSSLARALGINASSVSHMVQGHWLPRAATVAHLTALFHIDPERVQSAILQDCPLPAREKPPLSAVAPSPNATGAAYTFE